MRNILIIIIFTLHITSGCTPRGFLPPPEDEEAYTSKNDPPAAQVRSALDECGDSQPMKLEDGESHDNAVAEIDECMFRRGFYHVSGWGGMCASPNYRENLPACANAPIRPRWGYYGQ